MNTTSVILMLILTCALGLGGALQAAQHKAPSSLTATYQGAGRYVQVEYPPSTAANELQVGVTYNFWIPAEPLACAASSSTSTVPARKRAREEKLLLTICTGRRWLGNDVRNNLINRNCANSKLSQPRGSPHVAVPILVPGSRRLFRCHSLPR